MCKKRILTKSSSLEWGFWEEKIEEKTEIAEQVAFFFLKKCFFNAMMNQYVTNMNINKQPSIMICSKGGYKI